MNGGNFAARITVRVINLETRPDRRRSVDTNLLSIGVKKWELIPGVNGRTLHPDINSLLAGSIGCEVSHIEAISRELPPGSEGIMVCEDDLEFVCSANQLNSVVHEFLDDPRLDVLSISGRPRGGSLPISDNLRLVIGLVGRGCYVVKPHMVKPLLEVFGSGLKKLNRGNIKGKGDLEWRKAQLDDFFFAFPRIDLAQQSEGFSDIEGRNLGPR